MKKLENKESRKTIILICILIVLIGIICSIDYLSNNNASNKVNKTNKTNNTSNINNSNDISNNTSNIKLIDNLDVEVNSEVTLLSFISNKDSLNITSNDDKIDTSILGNKELTIKYKDNDTEKEYKFIINIKDTTSPSIKYQKELTTTLGEKIDLLKDVVVTDNSKEEIKATVEGEYDFNKEGTYNLKYIAIDSSNNKVEEEFTLKVNKKEENKTTNNNTNNATNTNNKKIVKTETKVVKDPETFTQYGVIFTICDVYKVYTYSDNTTKEEYSSSYYELNSKGFNATTSTLLYEAKTFVDEEQKLDNYNEMLSILNNYRKEVGANPLELDYNLSISATVRAMEMAYSGKFSHERPNMNGDSSCFTVLSDLGINNFSTAGENIAESFTSVTSVMNGWKNSPGHYQNMIEKNFKKVGFGMVSLSGSKAGYYWVQIFTG